MNEYGPTLTRRALLAGAAAMGVAVLASCVADDGRPPVISRTPTPTGTPSLRPEPSGWQSRLLRINESGQLDYQQVDGARLPDFGAAGFRGGDPALPDVDAVRRISPVPGDNTRSIQQAIDEVAGMRRERTGFRGAVQLAPGTYPITGTITLGASGVVLRGAGSSEDPSTATILVATGNFREVVVVGRGGSWSGERGQSRTDVVSDTVPIGSTTLRVEKPGSLRAGDQFVIKQPATTTWLRSVDEGGTAADADWSSDDMAIEYLRTIRDVSGDEVRMDAPLYVPLDRAVSQSSLYVWDEAGLVSFAGVENLRIAIAPDDQREEVHAESGIRLQNAQDCWVRDCTVTGFLKAGIVTITTTRTTIDGCHADRPAGGSGPARSYNFDVESRSQQILFTGCEAADARHAFIVNGAATASGVVFHRTRALRSLRSSEGHRRWSQGILFDNHVEQEPVTDRAILLGSRGDYGTGHGWSAVNSVAWGADAGSASIVVQRPPTAQNFAVGCFGQVNGDGPFDAPAGYIEGTGSRGLQPESLYEAQRLFRSTT